MPSILRGSGFALLVLLAQACEPTATEVPRALLDRPSPLASVHASDFTGDIGTVELLEPPAECEGDECRLLEVTCSGAIEPTKAEIQIDEPSDGGAPVGTVVLTKGGHGETYWQDFGQFAEGGLSRLNDQGYRTVQTRWETGWSVGRDTSEGMHNLACRGATLYKYVHDELGAGAFCATGNSGGGSLLAYAMSHYDLESLFDLAIPTSSPSTSDVETGCLSGESEKAQELEYPNNSKGSIDRSLGFRTDEVGSCEGEDESARATFAEMNLVRAAADFHYPDTKVHVVLGGDDDGNAIPQATLYVRELIEAGTDVSWEEIPGVGHAVPRYRDGVIAIYQTILEYCQL